MIAGHSSCSIHSGSACSLAASGEPRSPRPSPSRLRISSYRPTVMLREPIQPSPPSWAISVAAWVGDTVQSPTKGCFSSGIDIGGSSLQRPQGARQNAAPAGGPQLRKSGGPELRKSGGPQPRKSPGSELRKLSNRVAPATTGPPALRLNLSCLGFYFGMRFDQLPHRLTAGRESFLSLAPGVD